MRKRERRFVAAAVVGMFLAAASTAAASGMAIQFSSKGPVAEAMFSSFPASGNPVAGVVYTDTFLSAEGSTRSDSGRSAGRALLVDVYSYKFDADGHSIDVSYTSGEADGSAVTFSVAPLLTSASASATIALTTCTFDQTGTRTCSTPKSTAVSASWIGQGELSRTNSHLVTRTAGTTVVSNFHGTNRRATANAQIGANDVTDPLLGASIYDATQMTTCITHNGGCPS